MTPVYIGNVCDMLPGLAEKQDGRGVFHMAGPERLSRFDFGRKPADASGFGKENLRPVSVDDFQLKDNRPRDCSFQLRSLMEQLFDEPSPCLRAMAALE